MGKMVLMVRMAKTESTEQMAKTVRMEMLAQLVHKENKVPMV